MPVAQKPTLNAPQRKPTVRRVARGSMSVGLAIALTSLTSACHHVPRPPIDSCSWIDQLDPGEYIVRGSKRWDQVQATIGLNLALIEMSQDPKVREQAIVIIRSEIEHSRNILTADFARQIGAQNEAIKGNCSSQ